MDIVILTLQYNGIYNTKKKLEIHYNCEKMYNSEIATDNHEVFYINIKIHKSYNIARIKCLSLTKIIYNRNFDVI